MLGGVASMGGTAMDRAQANLKNEHTDVVWSFEEQTISTFQQPTTMPAANIVFSIRSTYR